jgi:C4-dicarboxylate transporter, DctQ subunit
VPDRVRPDQAGRVLDAIDTLSMWGAWASAACIASILGLIVAEVVSRNLFNISIYFAWEFSAYLMGAAFLMGAAYALRAGAQIRVNVLLENVPKPVARFFDYFSTICGIAIGAYLTWALAEMTWFSWVRESRSPEKSEILRWIVQCPLALGSLLFTLQTVARLGRLLRGEPGDDVRLRIGQDIE